MNKSIAASPKKIKNDISQFAHLIRERLGILIPSYQKKDLDNVICDACKKFNMTRDEYYHTLMQVEDSSPFIEHLATGITVGETYFFRDAHQMKLLQEHILPELIKRKRKEDNYLLRIWSAGSSSGEELYTIAMLLSDMLPDINAWNLKLLGTDINAQALKKAISGMYTEWSMRSTSEKYKQRYFTKKDQNYIISAALRNLVNFQYLNLNNDTFPSIINDTNAQDLIICRNVLIYFDRERGMQLMKKISSALVPGGYLILGASDPIYTTDIHLTFNYKEGPIFIRTLEKEHTTTFSANVLEKPIKKPEKIVAHKATVQKLKKDDSKDEKNKIDTLLKQARWQEALDIITANRYEVMQSAFLLSAKATALANLGKLKEAIESCYQSLEIDSTNINTHFTLAMVLVELNRIKEAEAELRKTLFLDHQFVMGHFQLGLLLIKNKQQDFGLKCLRNALSIVKSRDPNQAVTGFTTVCYGSLSEILEHEIDIHMTSARNTT